MESGRGEQGRRSFPPFPHCKWIEGGGGANRNVTGKWSIPAVMRKEDEYSGVRLGIMGGLFTIEQKLYCILSTKKKCTT